jgi:SulP family sulfate permease
VAKPAGENTVAVAVRAVRRWGGAANLTTVGVVVVVAVAMVVAPRIHRALPASLVGVVVASVVAQVAHLDVARIGSLPRALPLPALPRLGSARIGELLPAALAVALLGALESLLSARVADGMTAGRRHDPDRELFGQGLANLVSPLFGGMPATGAIARTAVNLRAGARTRVAAVTHALLLVAVVYLAGPLVSEIPLAALAGVLMVTAVRMIEPHAVAAVLGSTRADAAVFGLTAVATIAFDLIVAVEIGVAVAAVLALRSVAQAASATREPVTTLPLMFSRPMLVDDDTLDGDDTESRRIITYRMEGALFFGAAQRFLTELTAVSDVDVVILRLPELDVLDATGAYALGEIVRELEGRGITVLIKGPRAEHLRVLESVGALGHLAHERHLFASLPEAVAHARHHVRRRRRTAAGLRLVADHDGAHESTAARTAPPLP